MWCLLPVSFTLSTLFIFLRIIFISVHPQIKIDELQKRQETRDKKMTQLLIKVRKEARGKNKKQKQRPHCRLALIVTNQNTTMAILGN